MLVRRWLVQVVGFVVLVATAGCSGGGNTGSLATVSGVVTNNGAPVEGAKVSLYSTVESEGQKGGSYSATTDSSGKYVIASVGKEPGIPPGMYKVTITKMDVPSGSLPKEIEHDQGQIEAAGLGKNALPKAYENLGSTKLSVTLDVGKNENKNFELK